MKTLMMVVLVLSVLAPPQAQAQEGLGGALEGAAIIAFAVGIPVTATWVASTIISGSCVANDEQCVGWGVTSSVFGALISLGQVASLGIMISSDAPAEAYAFSLIPLALGVTSLGVGIAAAIGPDSKTEAGGN